MKLHPIRMPDNFNAYLEEKAGYHTWHNHEYIEPRYMAEISRQQADFLSKAGAEIYQLCLAAVEKVISTDRFAAFGIGYAQSRHITDSWKNSRWTGGAQRDPELYGRIDFCWDGAASAKFYEINADTPTTAYECSVVQWVMLRDLVERGEVPPHMSQFNTLEEDLIARFSRIRELTAGQGVDKLHFASMTEWKEDLTTTSYLEELSRKAGWDAEFLDIGLVGMDEMPDSAEMGTLYDTSKKKISGLYKLMPWEHMYETKWAKYLPLDRALFIEPPWKAILSNKMLSVVLWEMFPNHPLLLPAFTTAAPFNGTYVEKPIFGRISAGIKVFQDHVQIGSRRFDPEEPAAAYERYPKIYQQFCPLYEVPGLPEWRYQTGVWVVGEGKISGMDLRMDKALVTGGGKVKFLTHMMAPG